MAIYLNFSTTPIPKSKRPWLWEKMGNFDERHYNMATVVSWKSWPSIPRGTSTIYQRSCALDKGKYPDLAGVLRYCLYTYAHPKRPRMPHDLLVRIRSNGGQILDEVLVQVCQDLRMFETGLRLWGGWLVYFLFASFLLCSLCGSQPQNLGSSSACHSLVVHELYFCPWTPWVSTSWLLTIFFQNCIAFVDWLFFT